MNPGDMKALVIARRTRKNLNFIYAEKQRGADVEEFTQLLNSMLGMLICLREEYFKGKPEVTWDKVKPKGLQPHQMEGDTPSQASPRLEKIKTFSKLITNLRHAFAHNCFEIVGNPIIGVRVWNVPSGTPSEKANLPQIRTWQQELSEQQLRQVAELFISYLEKEHGGEMAEDAT